MGKSAHAFVLSCCILVVGAVLVLMLEGISGTSSPSSDTERLLLLSYLSMVFVAALALVLSGYFSWHPHT